MRETLKDWIGKITGYVDTDSNGNKALYDWQHKKLGRYDKNLDVTRDFYGRVVAKGDQLLTLLR